jgi:chemotaxis protein CheZ
MANQQLKPALKHQVDGLMRYMDRLQREIAAIHKPSDDDNQFETTKAQLEAIVKATENATDSIMDAVDRNEEVVNELRKRLTDPDHVSLLDKIVDNDNDVFEACSFQDISGQRVNKVVKSITYVEQRVDALAEIWGKAYLVKAKVDGSNEEPPEGEQLSGPQLNGDGLSQDDIDKLFD